MDRRRRSDHPAASLPAATVRPPPSPSPCLRDVSNYKTPRPHRIPNPSPSPIFFTASKKSPSSSSTSTTLPRRSNTARRLEALELDQSKSSRKVEASRERAVSSLSNSLSFWLNILFKDPGSCGCSVRPHSPKANENPESLDGGGSLGIAGGRGRGPKRQRRCVRGGSSADENTGRVAATAASYASLRASLKHVCSLEDMRERMEMYMGRKSCDEVLRMMAQVCKNIDEGRLKMKAHCPIVTDLRLKEKATQVLMNYNPMWLRIGLHIVLGGDSLLLNKGQSYEDILFLKAVAEKHFFSHIDLAKSYAYNKLVEGLYRPGYFEALGNIILKRILLLVISLDKAKCEGTLSIKYGIDGLDGGSPLLFCRYSSIKSSRQVIQEFLSEVMHGEGDLLAHLVIAGCRLNHQQSSLSEYNFNVKNLFEDIQDGILICRAIQLLQCDASILSKLVVPSDTRKKCMQNCSVALQCLKQAGVPLSDGDGVLIVAEDITNGDRELTLSILWNIFIHLQVPLLVDRASLAQEIVRMNASDMELSNYNAMAHMALLLEWVQVVCGRYRVHVDGFSSLVDGKAFHYLIKFYLGHEEFPDEYIGDLIGCYDNDPTVNLHGLTLARSTIAMLGSFPEVLPISDVRDEKASYDERIVIIYLALLASLLTQRKNLDQFASARSRLPICPNQVVNPSSVCNSPLHYKNLLTQRSGGVNMLKLASPLNLDGSHQNGREEWAAKLIQTRYRQFSKRKKFLKIKEAACSLQTVTRAWFAANLASKLNLFNLASVQQPSSDLYNRYFKFMFERYRFLRVKKSVLLIQRLVKSWIAQKRRKAYVNAVKYLQSHIRGHNVRSRYFKCFQLQILQNIAADKALRYQNSAAINIQNAWRRFTRQKLCQQQWSAAAKIQSHWRRWCMRKKFLNEHGAIIYLQAGIRCIIYRERYTRCKHAIVEIQRYIMGQVVRRKLLGSSTLQSRRSSIRFYNVTKIGKLENLELRVVVHSVLKLQRWWRQVLVQKSTTTSSVLVQSFIRGFSAQEAAKRKKASILIIQRWWREVSLYKLRERSACIIQACVRSWIARREVTRIKHQIVVIQSYWRGCLVRQASKEHLVDLRYRLKKATVNINDSMRLINRLLAALSELLDCKRISTARYTCATIDMATKHSQKCCEMLVAAGAIDVLLKQLKLLNRGVPDQEILKHVLSILRNIVRYPHLAHLLIASPMSSALIFQELLRNKGEGFFMACELLKKICTTQEGLEAISSLQWHVKRLKVLAQRLQNEARLKKRNGHLSAAGDCTIPRLTEVVSLLQLIDGGC